MKRLFHLFIGMSALWLGLIHSPLTAQQGTWNPDAPIPVDSAFTIGRLENGMTYFIRVNHKPEKRAELRLAVNAGSVLEDDDQRGIAHFAEHMAFNGTEHFEKQQIIDYLESVGMQYGPEINAYTGFNETVYMLQIPTDSSSVTEHAFQIMEDWARHVTFDSVEIDKERGVVIEEWRRRRGADARMLDKQFPILLRGSKYAERMMLGEKAVLDTFRYETLRRFYRDWYRPDLAAVIAVGDFEPGRIDTLVRQHFSQWSAPKKSRIRNAFPIPDHRETLFAIASDPEATGSRISVYIKRPFKPEKHLSDYRRTIVEDLYDGMMNERLSELTKKANPPFIYGYSGNGRLLRAKGVYMLSAGVKDNGIETGLEALLIEAKRVKRFGFTKTELDRRKLEMLRGLEQADQERDKTESSIFADEATDYFLDENPMPGISAEYSLAQQLLPTVSIDEINLLTGTTIADTNRVILVSVPDKQGVRIPTENELLAVYQRAEFETLSAYQDSVSDRPLIDRMPVSGTVVSEKHVSALGLTQWTLSNGVRIVLKPTDFKNEEILVRAFSPGGNSLVPDSNYIAALTTVSVMTEGGLGPFNLIELQKKLAGKIVNLLPQITQLSEGFSGSASPKDAETLFQMIYLFFTAPRKDSTTYVSYQSRMKAYIENRNLQPESAFQDTIQVTMAQHHFRSRPISVPILDEMDLNASYRVFRDRFADASDFTFFIVGSFEIERIRPFVLTYLGGLPSIRRKEIWRDVGIRFPKGIIKKIIRKGIEPKSRVAMLFTGSYHWNARNNYIFESMLDVMRIKLREVLRENMGGTYGVDVAGRDSRIPREDYTLTVSFGCAPERVDELVQAVLIQIDSLKAVGPAEFTLHKVKEAQSREYEVQLKDNGFWIQSLQQSFYDGEKPERLLNTPAYIKTLSAEAIRKAAKTYFNTENMVEVILLPEGEIKKAVPK
jgi:zinc protease